MSQEATAGVLVSLSSQLADVVERTAPSVVRVDDGSRLTATGILWSAEGVIVATSHGVERDEELTVELADGMRLAATLVGRDPDIDLAVLRVNATGLPAIERAGENEIRVGHLVLALGRPGTAGLQATIGVVGARIESQTHGQPGSILHTDAVLYPGFSGGPLVDVSGRMVGLNNLMFGRCRGVTIGTSIVAAVTEALLSHGRVPRGYLGVRTQRVALQENLARALQLEQTRGLLVVGVESGSPAEKGGLLLGDTLLGINERRVQDVEELRGSLREAKAGEAITLRILRGGQLQNLSVTLGAEP